MPTLTIRNMPLRVVRSLKSLAHQHGRSMEQEVRELIEEHVAEREAILEQIESSWGEQRRRPTAAEVDTWLERETSRWPPSTRNCSPRFPLSPAVRKR